MRKPDEKASKSYLEKKTSTIEESQK